MQASFVKLNALRADRHTRTLTRFGHIHRLAINQTAAIKLHQSDAVLDLFDSALKRVVLANKLRNETVLRAFIKLVRRRKLLDAAIFEHSNAI